MHTANCLIRVFGGGGRCCAHDLTLGMKFGDWLSGLFFFFCDAHCEIPLAQTSHFVFSGNFHVAWIH